jgi:HEAT repeat protein
MRGDRRLSSLLVLALACGLAGRAGAIDGDALARWLDAHAGGSLERHELAVVELRRTESSLPNDLAALVRDARRPLETRRRALELAGAVDDDAPSADALRAFGREGEIASAAQAASARVSERVAVLARLAELAQGPEASGLRGEDLRALGPSAASARELAALARDPLLDARRRRIAVLALPLVGTGASLDVLGIAADLATRSTRGDGAVRAAAIRLLGQRGAPVALARVLGKLCSDDDPAVARALLESMPLLADDDALRAFRRLALAEGSTVESRARALEALGWTRTDLARAWIEPILRDAVPIAEDELRAAAWSALGRLGARSAAETADALAALLSSPRLGARSRAIDALGELPRKAVEDALRPRLAEPTPDEGRLRAAEAARALGLRLTSQLEALARASGSSTGARTAAVRALAATGDATSSADALSQVLAQARDTDEEASLRRAAAEALGAPALRGDTALRALEAALGDPSSQVRIAAARALGAQGDARAATVLLGAIGRADLSSRERAEVVRALAALRALDDATAARVSGALGEDLSAEVALAATDYFSLAPRRLAIPALLDLLDHPDLAARKRAHANLLALTGEDVSVARGHDPFEYDPDPSANAERAEAVRKWRDWWEHHRPSYQR